MRSCNNKIYLLQSRRALLDCLVLLISISFNGCPRSTTIRQSDADAIGDIPDSTICRFHVRHDSTSTGPNGLTWINAFPSVQEGIDAAENTVQDNPDVDSCSVWISEGTYNIYRTSSHDTILLKPNVHLFGGFKGTELALEERDWETHETILDGRDRVDDTQQVHHVVIGSDNAVIDGFTITGGRACGTEGLSDSGGGMLNHQSASIIRNTVFINNTACNSGGGIANVESNAGISNSVFLNNTARLGGGIRNHQCKPQLSDCIFEANRAYEGGAIYNSGCLDMQIMRCTFHGNISDQSGGGIANHSELGIEGIDILCSPSIIDCVITGNTAARDGGGIFNTEDTQPSIINTVIAANTATRGMGGAIFNRLNEVDIVNCTISNNMAISGGGLYFESSSVNVANSILWDDAPDEIAVDLSELSVSYCNVYGHHEGEGNIDSDPLFMSIEDDDFRIGSGSPCIDAANGDVASEVDIAGYPRSDDPEVPNTGVGSPAYADIGAYEYGP